MRQGFRRGRWGVFSGRRAGRRWYGVWVRQGGKEARWADLTPSFYRAFGLARRLRRGRVGIESAGAVIEDWLLS